MFLRTGARMKVVKASLDYRDLNLDTDQVFPRLEARIASVKEIRLDPSKYFYFRNRAVSALEIHGPNDNGDAFEESELIKSYASFINSRESIDHNGEDIVGMVLDSAWIPFKGVFRPGIGIVSTNLLDYKQGDQLIGGWVENIHAMDREIAEERHPGIIQAMLNGEVTDTSMGCYCQSAICSICGNEATTEREYCEHIAYKGRKIAVAGEEKPVFEKNRGIVFFEDSIILPFALGGTAGGQGADPKAKQLQVFCSTHPTSLKPYIVNRSLQALAGDSYYKVGDKPESYDKNKEKLEEDHKKKVDKILDRSKEDRQEAREDLEKADEKFQDKIDKAEKKEATMERRAWSSSEIKTMAGRDEAMERMAGTAELPNTQAKANEFVEIYKSIDPGKTYNYDDMQGIMPRLLKVAFDDEMLDTIGDWNDPDDKDNTIKGSKIQAAMRKFARDIAKGFEEEGQEFFNVQMDPAAVLILKSLGSAVGASKKEEEKSIKAGVVTSGTTWTDIGIRSDVPNFVGFTAVYNKTGEKFNVIKNSDKGLSVTPTPSAEYDGVSKVHPDSIYAYAFGEGTWSLLTPDGKKIKFLAPGETFYTEASKKEDNVVDKKEEKTPSEKAFDYILKAILPKKDGGEGKSFADAQKEAMKLFGEEVKQEKFDQMKQEKEMKDKKKGGEDMKKGKEASLEIEAQKARMQEKLAKFFDGNPLGKAQEENIFDGKPKGNDHPENPFTGEDIPGGKGPKRDPYTGKPTAGEDKEPNPFKGKEAPGERGTPADDLFKGKDLPGGSKGQVNIFKELTSAKRELSLAKLKISTLEKRASEYQSKFSRAMRAYDIVTAMLSKGIITQADAKHTFEDMVNSSDEQLISTEKLVAVFKPNLGSRVSGLRDVRMSRIANRVPVEPQGAIAAPASAPVAGDGINDLDNVFMD